MQASGWNTLCDKGWLPMCNTHYKTSICHALWRLLTLCIWCRGRLWLHLLSLLSHNHTAFAFAFAFAFKSAFSIRIKCSSALQLPSALMASSGSQSQLSYITLYYLLPSLSFQSKTNQIPASERLWTIASDCLTITYYLFFCPFLSIFYSCGICAPFSSNQQLAQSQKTATIHPSYSSRCRPRSDDESRFQFGGRYRQPAASSGRHAPHQSHSPHAFGHHTHHSHAHGHATHGPHSSHHSSHTHLHQEDEGIYETADQHERNIADVRLDCQVTPDSER